MRRKGRIMTDRSKTKAALDWLGRNAYNPEDWDTMNYISELIEKATPEKPVFQHRESWVHTDYADGHGETKPQEFADWFCPACGWFVGEQYTPMKHNQRKSSYCARCGQAIDWEVQE